MQNVTIQTYKLKTDSQNKKLSFSYFSNLTLHCLDAKKSKQTEKNMQNTWYMLNLSKWTRKKMYDIQL